MLKPRGNMLRLLYNQELRISSGVCVPAVCGTEFGLADTREC